MQRLRRELDEQLVVVREIRGRDTLRQFLTGDRQFQQRENHTAQREYESCHGRFLVAARNIQVFLDRL
ncbi:MAG TPA: hypothetical protein VH458_11235 [Vicinamibacterales bacterium]